MTIRAPIQLLKPLLLAAAVLAALISAGCGRRDSSAELLQQAQSYHQKGERNAAIIELKNLLQKDPDNAEARYLLGALYNESWNSTAAENELRRAQQLNFSKGGRVQAQLAWALLREGKLKEIIDTIQASQGFEAGERAKILALRGLAYLGLDRLGDAKTMLGEAAQLGTGVPEVFLLDAQIRLSENDVDGALGVVGQALTRYPQDVNAWVLKADLLRFQGKDKEALAAYDRALQLSPGLIPVKVARAGLLILQGEYEPAQKDIDEIRKLVKDYPMAFYLQALLDFRQGKYRSAQISILEALKYAPSYPPAQLLSAAIDYALGAFAQAEHTLTQFLFKFPDNDYARKLLASALLELNQGKRALEVIQPMLGKKLEDSTVLALAGDAYLKAGNLSKASEYMQKAIATNPKSATLRTAYALSQLGLGDVEKAITELEAASGLDTAKYRADIILVLTQLRQGQYDQALAAARTLEKKQPNNPLTYNLLGAAYLSKNDSANARKNFERAVELQPTYFPAVANLAQLDLLEHKPGAARHRFEAVLAKDKDNLQAMLALAQITAAQGKSKESLDWLERARKAHPAALEPRSLLVGHYIQAGQTQKALEIAQEALSANVDHPVALELVGNAQLANGDRNSALATFNKLVTVAPALPLGYYRLGVIQAGMGDFKSAEANYRKALELTPRYLEAQAALAALLVQTQRLDEAMHLADQVKKAYPKSPAGSTLEGDVLMAQKKYTQAAKAYETAFNIDKNGTLAIKIFMADARAGNRDAALARLRQWIKGHPDDLNSRMYLADALMQLSQFQEAVQQYEFVLQKSPENLLALNNLAEAYRHLRDPRAFETAEKAYKLNPNNPLIEDTLGWILVGQGETARGLKLLEKAAIQAPDVAEIRYHFAVALAKTGDKAKARKELEELIASGKKFTGLEDAKALLKQL